MLPLVLAVIVAYATASAFTFAGSGGTFYFAVSVAMTVFFSVFLPVLFENRKAKLAVCLAELVAGLLVVWLVVPDLERPREAMIIAADYGFMAAVGALTAALVICSSVASGRRGSANI